MSIRKHAMCAVASAAILLAAAAPAFAQRGGGPSQEAMAAASKIPTPRLDGKPDLTGFWGTVTEFGSSSAVERSADGKTIQFIIYPPFAQLPEGTTRQGARAGGAGARAGGAGARAGGAPAATPAAAPAFDQRPTYKKEHLEKVEKLRVTDVDTDPSFICKPHGTPRIGIPTEIFQSKDAVVFLYQKEFRVIPTDGRKHDETLDPSWFGDSVGRWEGDSLVINTVNLTDESWLGGGGWFHSDKLTVVEKLTRVGNTLRWEATATDPEVLTKPWVMPPRTVLIGKAGAHVVESPPCEDRVQPHMVDKYHITP